MFKRNIYILFILVLGISCQEKNQTIEEFGQSVYLTYKTDLTKQKELYLNKSELKQLLKNFGQTDLNDDQITEHIDFTIEKQKEHIALAKYDMEIVFKEFKWNDSKIDSINYDIIFPKPGKDSIIHWPKSKTIEFENLKEFFVAEIHVFGNDNNKKIQMNLNSVVYINNELKLYQSRPKFEYINKRKTAHKNGQKIELKLKIGFTLAFILGFFFLRIISKRNSKKFKRRMEKNNPKLVKQASWFFSDTKQKVIHIIFGIMLLIFLILIWTNYIVIPIK